MLTAVAGARPYDVFTLVDEPLWRILYVFHHLEDSRARVALRERVARVDSGFMTALAFNSPEKLDDQFEEARRAIVDYEAVPADRAAEIASVRARAESLSQRIESGRVLSVEALVS